MADQQKPRLITREEIAQIWGIEPESVRSTMRRYGIHEERGYDREAFERIERPGQGRRTDLLNRQQAEAEKTP